MAYMEIFEPVIVALRAASKAPYKAAAGKVPAPLGCISMTTRGDLGINRNTACVFTT
jgi:hypothetical protein